MTTVITKATPADLLAALPALVGREPRNSVVLLAFRAKRTHAALRYDIPSSGYKRFAATAVGTFCKIPGADDVVPVICTDAPLDTHAELMSTLIRRFEQAGYPLRDAFVIGSNGWASHFSAQVHPLSEIAQAAAQLSLDPPVEAPRRVPRADDLACRRMRDELDKLRIPAVDDDDVLEPLYDLPLFAEGALGWDSSERTQHGALLLFALQGPPARDLVMLQWAFGLALGDAMWSVEACADIEARKTYSRVDLYASELMLGHGHAPDSARIEAGIAVLTDLVSRAANAERPAPLCMLAWLNWARGRGSVAGLHIDEAREIDPDYSMGQLLDTIFSSGMLPEWAFISPQNDVET